MAGNLIAPVEDGKIVETESQSSLKKANNKNSMYSKDTFLQLLVAEVQNQDPLEPTSNRVGNPVCNLLGTGSDAEYERVL